MAATPSFAATPRVGAVAISTSETSRTAPSSVGTVFTAGANGSVITEVCIQATGTTTANMVRLFLYDGSTYYLLNEIRVRAVTPSDSIRAYHNHFRLNSPVAAPPLAFGSFVEADQYMLVGGGDGLPLPTGWSLRATTDNAEGYVVLCWGGDY